MHSRACAFLRAQAERELGVEPLVQVLVHSDHAATSLTHASHPSCPDRYLLQLRLTTANNLALLTYTQPRELD